MIILFSHNGDRNTNHLIDWLEHFGCIYERINLPDEDFHNISVTANDDFQIALTLKSGRKLKLSDIDFFFVRGRGFERNFSCSDSRFPSKVLDGFLKQEYSALVTTFYAQVNLKAIGCFAYSPKLNKLNQLNLALKVGLSIPPFAIDKCISNKVHEVAGDKLIVKAIEKNLGIDHDEKIFVQRVQRLEKDKTKNRFFPTFFQQEIIKDYEIRIFYLDGEFYSIKFGSESVKVDMRENYSESWYEPYELPKRIKIKITELMKGLSLISGSIDMLKSIDGTYYFLEVNPNGQYDWVSKYGGHNLHKRIAMYLAEKQKINLL